MRRTYLLGVSIFAVLVIAIGGYIINQPLETVQPLEKVEVQGAHTQQTSDISYQGQEGVNALTLLKKNFIVEEKNGFVTSIQGRSADEGKREFWAFYVNGEQAPIGAGEYITHDTDEIVWKIETY